MNIRTYALTLLIAFSIVAVFGLFLPSMNHMEHDMGCPFAPGDTALCATPLAHLGHWQTAFTAVLVELLTLFALAVLVFVHRHLFELHDKQYERHRWREHVPIRPTLFQELFSQGLLNPKVP